MVQAAKKAYGQSASLDCHLTQALVQRFMKGDELSDDLLTDVEKHLAVCAECMAVANGTSKPMSQRSEPNPMVSQALAVIQQPKHLLMLGALAVVLVLMGTVLRNPTALLGPKASVAKAEEADEAKTSPKPKAKAEAEVEPEKPETAPTVEPSPKPEKETPHEAVLKTESTESASSALEALQAADPAPSEEKKPEVVVTPTPKVNEGPAETPVKKNDVIVVRESAPAPVRSPRKMAKPIAKKKAKKEVRKPAAKPKAAKSHENQVVLAPRKAAPKQVVVVFDENGKPVRGK